MDNSEKIFDILKKSGKMMRIGDIVKSSGLEKPDVEKAIKDLKKKDLIFSPERCFWQAK